MFKDYYAGFRVKTARDDGWGYSTIDEHKAGSEGKVEARILRSGNENCFPTFGATWKRMYVCQPPVKHMTVTRLCSSASERCLEVALIASIT